MVLALYSSMTNITNQEKEEEWRKLCELIAHEPDPQRLSKLVDQLIKELDDRRQELVKTTKQRGPAADDK
jgi:hypothetical protein